MNGFKGFTPECFMLLELNRFNDSKDFYESVKEDIKNAAIVPMRNLAGDLSEELYSIDPLMNLIPTKMVSRIRRDTRFSKNKHLYRENVWCMFMRDKHSWNYQPCMWFEIYPGTYSYGVGMFRTDADYLEQFRSHLLENQQSFKDALRMIEITGAICCLESYKKEKPGTELIDKSLRKYYNCKNMMFIYNGYDVEKLFDGSIKQELTYAIRAFAPMYKFLLQVTENIYKKGDLYE